MLMELKKSKKNKISTFLIGLSLVWCLSASAETPARNMDYWVQIDELKNDLAMIEKIVADLPDAVLQSELRICMADNQYALVYKAGKDSDAAALIQDKLSQHLKNKILTSVVPYDHSQCFYTAYMFNQKNKVKAIKPVSPTKKKNTAKSAVHLYPDLKKGATDTLNQATKSTTTIANATSQVLPEVASQVNLSNLDINRITCMGDRPVKDIIFSAEKGITTKINGSNAFIKLQLHQTSPGAVAEVIDNPVELYVVCGNENDVYTLIGVPKKIPAQWIQLVSKTGNIKKNLALFEGKDFEKKIVTFMRQAWTQDYPDSYTVKNINVQIIIAEQKWLDINLQRIVNIDGEGFILKEYLIRLNPDSGITTKQVREKDFLLPQISSSPLAITLDSLSLEKNVVTRLFVVERSGNDHGIHIGGTKN